MEETKKVALKVLKRARSDDEYGEVDNSEGLLMEMKSLCLKMDSGRFWRFVTGRKKELESLRAQMSLALAECVDPARFVLEAISEVFPVDKRSEKSDRGIIWAGLVFWCWNRLFSTRTQNDYWVSVTENNMIIG